MSAKLVLVRHGQSQWNLDNRFTGWVDVDLTDAGRQEAIGAGQLIADSGIEFDVVYTSVLTRAIRTCWTIMDGIKQMWLPVTRAWELNERHYGGLAGLNKAETAAKYGDEQVHIWRRSFDTPPPPLDADDESHPRFDRRYANVDAAKLPSSESLSCTLKRVLPYWNAEIAPQLKVGKNVLIVAHGNSLRALVKHLNQISDDDIASLNIPTASPWLFELNDDLSVVSEGYMGDADAVAAAAAAVAAQGKG